MSGVPGDRPLDIASGPTCADPPPAPTRWTSRSATASPCPRPRWTRCARAAPSPSSPAIRAWRAPRSAWRPRRRWRWRRPPPWRARPAYDAHILGDALEGEARDVGKVLAGIALQAAEREQPPACVLLSGGETTVTVRQGSGGRNVECCCRWHWRCDHPRIHALMADTDGVDGAEDIAGARIGPQTLARAWALGIKPAAGPADDATVSSRRWVPRS